MSRENVEAVRGVFERWRDGDLGASVALFDREAVLVHHPDLDVGSCYGRDAIVAYTRRMLEPWSRLTLEGEETIDAGESVVVRVRQRGEGRASGVATELAYFLVWTFRGDRVIRLESFRDRAEALEAVGLTE
jgi:ketosteroid isomerase-like protein